MVDQPTLFDAADNSRKAAPDPATKQGRERLSSGQALVKEALLLHGPMSDEDIYDKLRPRLSPSGARTRRAELVKSGEVVPYGTTKTRTGRTCCVWKATGGTNA